ncbi:MAG: sulfurtransferase [Limnobacter sp.]|nr:sulfurtransferase [Limnobacter sp.]
MNQPVIGVQQLAGLMQSARPPVVVDCRFNLMAPEAGQNAYLTDHVPGAFYAHLDHDLSDKTQTLQGRHPLPSASQFESLMQSWGVDADSLLVAYDEGDLSFASRLWWLARYFGHQHVSVLNGGYAAWRAGGNELENGSRPVGAAAGAATAGGLKPGGFKSTIGSNMKLDYAEVLAIRSKIQLIDSRDAPRYKGEVEPIDPVAGHIPGAVNAPWKDALGPDGLIKSQEELQARWAGLMEQGKAPVVYCGSGVTACVNLLSMEVAGVPNVRLYAGSWSGWLQNGGDVAVGG